MIKLYYDKQYKIINLRKHDADIEVYKYLKDILQYLYINVYNDYEGNIINLMKRDLLEGFCFQTTNSSISFFNDDDYILRGNLYFTKEDVYYHSWICFKYKNQEYIFDPCLNICCKRKFYDKTFEVEVKGMVFAKRVREDLINKIKYHNLYRESFKEEQQEVMKFFLNKYGSIKEEESLIIGDSDVFSPIYEGVVGYSNLMLENKKIKSLNAHYYKIG